MEDPIPLPSHVINSSGEPSVRENGDANAGHDQKKRLSVERIYQKKTQLEHILLRPDSYIGSTLKNTQTLWVLDEEQQCMVNKDITFSPGLYKIFDEILVNAADNKVRDPSMSCIKIDIKPEENMIRIWNNGKGIPVVHHKIEKVYVPSLIFGQLLTSSNYDDTERKVTGGRNGYGAKLCNIFSKKFIVETSSKEYKKSFRQTWTDNMTKTTDPKISMEKDEDFTCITFYPDLARFGMTELDSDTVALFVRRAYDLAGTSSGVKVFLNGKRLPVKCFMDYINFYVKSTDDEGTSPKIIYESVNPRWQVAVAASNSGFQQVSFVNSIATTKGGKHVDYVADQIINKLIDIVKKKAGKSGVQIKPFQIKNHMWLFVNCLIENPTFDSQTKENMTLLPKSFGSTCSFSEKFMQQTSKCGIVESVLSWVRFKAMEKMDKQCHKSKHVKLKGIPKLDDANNAGTKNSSHCTLILTEGDSAKSLAVAGLGVIGRDNYGVFPLRGKLLNVREAPSKQIMENVEINALIKILGLQYKHKYESPESLKDLRYGKVMIMTDQDQDGSHIKGLIINFIHCNWPNLLKHNVLEEFITPIVKVFKGKEELSFYSLPEFEEWQQATSNWHTWRIKYYKGLGTSSGKEARDYFSDMTRHRIRFRYTGHEDDQSIQLAFDKSKSDERKNWLAEWTAERKRRRELGLPELYLYGKETRAISFHDFVHKELVLFSNLDNERSIPCVVDGLKPGQRKVLFTCLKRNLVKELKVAQLAGSVAELSAYHHGEQSLMGTIVGLAQNFVGSNNLNLLLPIGQFGTRLTGGKDAASARYIFTALSPLTRLIFHPADDPLLNYLRDDNQRIEPEWYCPIVPMVLINGAEGIGTGYSTKIPNYDVLEVIANLYRLLDGEDPVPMLPSFRGFRGTTQELAANRYVIHGEIAALDEDTVEITELPIRTWTQNYKESVLEVMLNGTDKIQPCITDYKEYHTDTTVRFVIKMTPEKLQEAESVGFHKFFKLSTALTTNSMVGFDYLGCLRRYDNCISILREFYDLRLQWYGKRKSYMEGMLAAEARKLENQARFVLEKIENKISIENKPRKELIRLLQSSHYDSDPVRAWKECLDKLAQLDEDQSEHQETVESGGPDYNYILGMPLWSLTKERKDDLLAQRDAKRNELRTLREKTPSVLWREDLRTLEEAYKKYESELASDEVTASLAAEKKASKGATLGSGGRANAQKFARRAQETKPDPNGRRIAPVVDPDLLKKLEVERKRRDRKANTNTAGDGALDASFEDEFDFGDPDGEGAPKPLLQRLASATNGQVLSDLASARLASNRGRGGRGRGARVAGAPKSGARPATSTTVSPVKKRRMVGGTKRKTSRKAWESGSDSDFSASIGSDVEFEPKNLSGSPDGEAPVRVRRTAAAKSRYVFDIESSDEENEGELKPVMVDHSASDDDEPDTKEATGKPDSPLTSDDEFNPQLVKPIAEPSKASKSRGGSTTALGSKRGRGAGRGAAKSRATVPTTLGRSQSTLTANSFKKPVTKKATDDSGEGSPDDDSLVKVGRTSASKPRHAFDIESSDEEDEDEEKPAPVDIDDSASNGEPESKEPAKKPESLLASDDDLHPLPLKPIAEPSKASKARGGSTTTLGSKRGRGAGRGAAKSRATVPTTLGRGQSTLTANSFKKPVTKKATEDSGEGEDDANTSSLSKTEARMNARRVVTDKAHYVFNLASSDEDETGDGGYHPVSKGGAKRTRKTSDEDDDDFDPSAGKKTKRAVVDFGSDSDV